MWFFEKETAQVNNPAPVYEGVIVEYFHTVKVGAPGAPLIYFSERGQGMKDFFGSEIFAKKDFFGSLKGARIFWGHEKIQGFFGVSAQINNIYKCKLLLVLDFFLVCQKKAGIFFG